MLFLLFELDGERYALEATRIVEVLALAPVKSIPGAPPWLAGAIDRHGKPVPVIDVAQLALGRAARRLRSTRLVVVRYHTPDTPPDAPPDTGDTGGTGGAGGAGGAAGRMLGLIVEHATQTCRIDPARFADSGIATPHARWLGPVAGDASGFVQWVDVRRMIDDDARALLFPPAQPLPQAISG
ncbi:chemotaxis protein CheW [Burkholderia ubonensis]|uniref:chemotaxis protein CheW n=1 Tax=Burkholderia ubonensis TaxID=101571 RepID=UPI000BA5F506|nr:chemotaxis protein CheW [Burkholderia ubonensis]PAJ89800.1 chemotaxis protein CheW [Burkholderia ubonensis]PAJ96568.1 chemotaxis protein CheW [Burkholderia ubonensis]PAK07337.1 chemotaxis protein CheW [Burkholderia ubonensis]RQP81853.1 chemotaxis protein CheW [Burkholderia ubonensis]RQP90903.1 chemotaxis protein CheW [Burkholderia ubonensis]